MNLSVKVISDILIANPMSIWINMINLLVFLSGMVILIRASILQVINRFELNKTKKALYGFDDIPSKTELFNVLKNIVKFRGGVLYRIITALNTLSQTNMEDREKLVQLEEIRNDSRTAVPKAVPGLAVSIGFFGTVLGLFWAIDSMPGMFNVQGGLASEEGFQRLTSSMVYALDGMRTAFGTTIVGLVFAVFLSIGNVIYKVCYDLYEHHLQRLVTLKIYPVFSVPEKENLIDKLVDIMNASRETLRTIEHSNSRLVQSVEDLANNMNAYNRDNEKVIRQVSEVVREFLSSQQGMKEVYDSINTIANETRESYTRIQGLLDSASEDREAFLSYLKDSRNDIRENSAIQQELNQKTNREFLRHLNSAMEENLDRIVQTYDAFHQHFTETQKNMIADALTGYQALIEKSTEKISGNVDEFKELLDDFKNNIVQNNKQYESETRKLVKELSGILQKVIESNSTFIGNYN